MTPNTSDQRRDQHESGDGWVACSCGSKHWGLHGAAGLLLRRHDPRTGRTDVVLQHRALWSHQGGTWGVPGGAITLTETAVQGALREAHEEAGIHPDSVLVRDEHVLDHGPWQYTTVLGDLAPGWAGDVSPTDPESLDILWVGIDEVTDRPLLPAFAAAWPTLRILLEGRAPH